MHRSSSPEAVRQKANRKRKASETEASARHRRSVPRYWIEALFAKVSNAKRLLAPDPVMLPDKQSNALLARY